MMRTHGLTGVPSTAGGHYPGQEKTPATLQQLRSVAGGKLMVDGGTFPCKQTGCKAETG
jgi:hypothetical protein